MTEKKLQEALSLKDDITRVSKYIETINHLFEEWNKIHQTAETDVMFVFIDHKKEWEIISQMASEFDDVREAVIRETLHRLRVKQRELRENLTLYEQKYKKL